MDAESSEPVSGSIVGGRTLTDGVETNNIPPYRVSASDGSFALSFGTGIVPCDSADYFPDPDQVEIIITRNGCEQRFLIEINEDTARFVDEGQGPILEVIDPISVPPCEELP